MQGVVKTFLPEKQYGFIKGDDGKDYFFHASAFKDKQQVENVCEESRVQFEQVATPKGYQAKKCELLNPEEVNTYIVPSELIVSKSSTVKGWEIIEEGEWFVHGCSRDSPDAAKRMMISRAESLGVNALLFVDYYKETGSEAGTSLHGEHKFTIHCFRGLLANVAKRNALGKYKHGDLFNIKSKMDALEQSFLKDYKQKKRVRRFKIGILFTIGITVMVMVSSSVDSGNMVSIFLLMLCIPYVIKKPTLGEEWLEKG